MHRATPLSLLIALSAAAPAARAADADTPTLDLEMYTLDNGLTVVLAPDTSTPIVHTQIWYHVGSKDESEGLTGFAHLFEHLMFQGSLNTGSEYFAPIQEVGGTLNGTTNQDRTNYFETVPSRYLPLALFMESDRMGNLLPVLDQLKLDNQRDVVRNERRQRVENPPYGDVWLTLDAAQYPEGHPYHHPTIGSHVDLQNATLADVQAFFRTWYVPNNATLVVAGDFDVAATKALVAEQFGWIPAGADPVHTETRHTTIVDGKLVPSLLPASQVIHKYGDVPDRKLWMSWHSPALFADGDAELDLAASALCGGKDSRMYTRLVDELRLVTSISCHQGSQHLDSTFLVMATAAPGHTTDEVVTAVEAVLADFQGPHPITDDELLAGVTQYEVGSFRGLQTIQGRAGTISSYLYHTGKPDWIAGDLARYRNASTADVMRVLGIVLAGPHITLHYLPDADRPAAAEETN
ncbi:MAG: insulinase family protein [Alphaproteobacteria bacterium]|nr:insulinase family protein [Alphaproteobacteria bacterium]